MLKINYYLIFFVLLLSTMVAPAQNIKQIVDDNTKFSFSLYKELAREHPNQNILFSPLSISQAMAITYAGARNNTETQIADVLHFTANQKEFHSNFSKLNTQLINNSDSINLNIANCIWAQKGYKFVPEYFKLIENSYKTPINYVNFTKNKCRIKAVEDINEWVSKKTDKQIVKIIEPEAISKLTRLIIVNAINFYGEWFYEFNTKNTDTKIFYSTKGEEKTKFMHQSKEFLFYNDDMISAIQLPYKGKKQSMIIILPTKEHNINEVEKTFDNYYLTNIIADMQKARVNLSLPKFNIESSAELKKTFQKMGITDAFSKNADFTGMTNKNDLKIDKIIHKAKIEVSEKGTKASAATAVVMIRKTAYVPRAIFNANHPFIYLIRDNTTGTILFMGKLSTMKQ